MKRGKAIEFIDDAEYDESVENYRAFDNVSRDYDDAINDSLSGFNFSEEAANYCSDNEVEEEVHNSRDYKKKVHDFKKTLVNPHGDDNSDSFFFFAILYATRFQLTEKTNTCVNQDKLKNDINKVDLPELFLIKNKLKLDFEIINFGQ